MSGAAATVRPMDGACLAADSPPSQRSPRSRCARRPPRAPPTPPARTWCPTGDERRGQVADATLCLLNAQRTAPAWSRSRPTGARSASASTAYAGDMIARRLLRPRVARRRHARPAPVRRGGRLHQGSPARTSPGARPLSTPAVDRRRVDAQRWAPREHDRRRLPPGRARAWPPGRRRTRARARRTSPTSARARRRRRPPTPVPRSPLACAQAGLARADLRARASARRHTRRRRRRGQRHQPPAGARRR